MLKRVISLALTACLTTLPLAACASNPLPPAATASRSPSPAVGKVAAGPRVADHYDNGATPSLHSNAALVMNAQTGELIYAKNNNVAMPIASITKVMTAMVVLDGRQSLGELITITDADVDKVKRSGSRLAVGVTLTRHEMLLLALMSSENRAASSLARTYPGGTKAFVAKMNQKARAIGMRNAVFYDGTGLNSGNSATATDLARMVQAAYHYPLIRQFTTTAEQAVQVGERRRLQYRNSNALVREGEWQIGLSKTGYIKEAGRCLVMQATVNNLPLVIVLLDGAGSQTRIQDARSIRAWLERLPGSWLAG